MDSPLSKLTKNQAGGIRSIKQMFTLLKAEEKKKVQMIDEEDCDSSDNE